MKKREALKHERQKAKRVLYYIEKRFIIKNEEGVIMEWILLKDKKPEEGQRVIYYLESFGIFCGVYYRRENHDCFTGVWGLEKITHWMPLPEPPK